MESRTLAMLCTTGIFCFAILVFGIIGYIAFSKTQTGTAKSFGLLFRRGNFLQLFTVIIIIIAVIFLGLQDVIKENGIVGILSGIAGYVLGGLELLKSSDSKDEEIDNPK